MDSLGYRVVSDIMELEVIGDQVLPSTSIAAAHLNSIESIAARPDGIEVATGSHDHTIKLWDVEEAKSTATLQGHKQGIWSLDYAPNGGLLMSASADGTIMMWDSKTGKAARTLTGHQHKVYCAKFNDSGTQIASCGEKTPVLVWDIASGSVSKKLKEHQLTYHVDWSKNKQHIISSTYSGDINVYDSKTYDLLTTTKIQNLKEHRIYGFDTDCSLPQTRIYAACQDSIIREYTLDKGQLQLTHSVQRMHFGEVKSIVNNEQKRLMLSSGRDGAVKLWHVGKHGINIKCNLVGHEDNVSKAVFVPNASTIVAAGGWDQRLNIWRLKI